MVLEEDDLTSESRLDWGGGEELRLGGWPSAASLQERGLASGLE